MQSIVIISIPALFVTVELMFMYGVLRIVTTMGSDNLPAASAMESHSHYPFRFTDQSHGIFLPSNTNTGDQSTAMLFID